MGVQSALGRMEARAVLRLLVRADDMSAVLFMDDIYYSSHRDPALEEQVVREAKSVSDALDIPMYRAGDTIPGPSQPKHLSGGGLDGGGLESDGVGELSDSKAKVMILKLNTQNLGWLPTPKGVAMTIKFNTKCRRGGQPTVRTAATFNLFLQHVIHVSAV